VSNLWFLIVLIPSIVLHEVSHGWVAYLFGDNTAKEQGRLNLNPMRHIDPVGSLLLPAVLWIMHAPLFGWAKPVPVSINRLRHPRWQSVLVSLAGPLTNITLSAVGLAMSWYGLHVALSAGWFLAGQYVGLTNLSLAIFNLIPIPPLDGSALIEGIIPRRQLPRYFDVRQRALPFLLVALFISSYAFHVWDAFFNDATRWWLSLLV